MENQLQKDIRSMREALDEDLVIAQPRMPSQPLLVAMCGLPGTGKSHFASKLSEEAPFSYHGDGQTAESHSAASQVHYPRTPPGV
ncbi:MAG: hypothetical protein Ct9H300mP11_15830 [Chloroflexota bacterium]|nr:MAG: hypothetical protein Ct9H300mP11_15830 [Chloroflexota bacterium]